MCAHVPVIHKEGVQLGLGAVARVGGCELVRVLFLHMLYEVGGWGVICIWLPHLNTYKGPGIGV